MDARRFLGIEPVGDELHWQMEVRQALTTPGGFLFGGCGLGAALVALEAASGRPTVWATAQYLSFAAPGSILEVEVTLAVEGHRVTQARGVGRVEGREILTVNAALGTGRTEPSGLWVSRPDVPPPGDCPPRRLPARYANTILEAVEVRVASGREYEDLDGTPGEADSALWARVPGHLDPSAATLAIFGDYLPGAAAQPLGQFVWARSLDNTLRIVQLAPTEWVLCDNRMHAFVGGFAQGIAFLWSEDGTLLATASQSMALRPWSAHEARQMLGIGGD